MNPVRRIAALSAAALLATAGLVRAQVINEVPADAIVAVKISNLAATSKKIAKLANEFGIAAFLPNARDPLGSLMRDAKITNGVDTAGELALVYIDPAVTGGDEARSVVVLVPVTDYAAFIGNFEGAKTENGITEAVIGQQAENPDGPQPSYIANWGKYAAISPTKLIVEKQPEKKLKPQGLAGDQAAKQDFIVYANVTKIRESVLPEIEKNREKMFTEMNTEIDQNAELAKYKPLLNAAANQGLNAVTSFLRDSDAATIGVNISDAGINTTVLAEFKPDSYLGNVVKGIKNTDQSLTTGLPNSKYLFFGGASFDSATSLKLFDDLTGPIVAELDKSPDFAPLKTYATTVRKFVGAVQGTTFGAFTPTGAIGQEAVLQTIGTFRGDAATIESSYKAMNEQLPALLKSFTAGSETKIEPKVTVTPNAKTIDGVAFTSYVTDTGLDPESPEGRQQKQVMDIFYGPEGQTVNLAKVGSDVFYFQGVADDKVSTALTALKAKDKALANLEPVKVVVAELPKQRFAEFYIPLDEIINTSTNAAAQFGFPVQLELPPDLSPIGVTVGTEGSALRIDSHIPSSTVQSVIAATMQVMMQMNGGARPGGAGGL